MKETVAGNTGVVTVFPWLPGCSALSAEGQADFVRCSALSAEGQADVVRCSALSAEGQADVGVVD